MNRASLGGHQDLAAEEALLAGRALLEIPSLLGYEGTLAWADWRCGVRRALAIDLMDQALDSSLP